MFAATSLAGQAVLPAVGEERKGNSFHKKVKLIFFRDRRSSSGSRRNPCNLHASLLYCTLWPVLPAPAGAKGKAQMSTILLAILEISFSGSNSGDSK